MAVLALDSTIVTADELALHGSHDASTRLLGPKRADDQSHTSSLRVPKHQGQNLAESEEPTDLTQPQQNEKQHHHDSHF